MRPTLEELETLKVHGTPRQREIIEAVQRLGDNYQAAAKELGIARTTVRDAINGVRRRVTDGLLAMAPNGQAVRGVSTLVDADGNPKLQWIKTQRDAEEEKELIDEAFRAAAKNLRREKPIKAPAKTEDDLLNLFIVTDYHIGMRSWPDETGDDWDTDLAEDMLVRWFAKAIQSAPKAHTAIFGQLGDFLHWDGLESVTPNSGHVLDADTRYQKLVSVSIGVCRRVVRMLLKKHQHVHILMAEGNHDESGSAWLRELFHALYDDEPRVTVDKSADIYYHYEWGDVSLFFHHGHKRKPENIDDVFVSKFRELFGRTKHSYAHMGHVHHFKGIETNLMIVEQHPTLAARDAYASRGGWLAGRRASVITYHKEYGETERHTKLPEML